MDDEALTKLFKELPADLRSSYILEYKENLENVLKDVTKKLLDSILSHQPTYLDELKRIADLQSSITESIQHCSRGRSYLMSIKEGTANGLIVVENQRRRDSLSKLLNSLTGIRNLRKSVLEIIALIESQDDFPKAIQMCKDGKKLLSTFEHYKCIDDLSSKLNESIDRMWHDMNTKLRLHILNNDFSDYRFDEFIRILNVGSLLATVGDELFLTSSSTEIEKCINSLAQDFFNAYHKFSMDELKMFLDNELWEIVPVKNDFRLVHLKEFSFLRASQLEQQPLSKLCPISDNNPNKDSLYSYSGDIEPLQLDKISLSTISDDEEFNTELEKDFVEEDESDSPPESLKRYSLVKTNGPVLTNSSLNVLRLIGKYIQMMSLLEPISYEILMKVYSLLDYYTMEVLARFGPDKEKKIDDKSISPKIRSVVRSIRESLIKESNDSASAIQQQAVPDLETIFGRDNDKDHRKAVAIESLIYLVNQLWNLQQYLESLIPAQFRPKLEEQFTQADSIVPDFLKARAELDSSVK